MLIAQRIIGKVSVLSNAQRRFLVLAVQAILCCRWRTNFASMARVSSRTEKTFRRHFKNSIDFPRIHREVVDTVLPKDGEGLRVIGFDPAFIPKSGTHTPGVSKFWNGSAQRAESGLEATVMAVIDVRRRIAMPLAIHQTLRPAASQAVDSDVQSKKEKEVANAATQTTASQTSLTKADTIKDERWLIEEYLRHIKRILLLLTQKERHLVVDAYFAKKSFLDAVEKLALFCITRLRKDANMKYFYAGEKRPGGRGRQKVYGDKVDWKNLQSDAFERTVLDDGTVLLSALLYHVGLKRRFKVVIVQKPMSKGVKQFILASTDESLDATSIYRAYAARFQVEFIIRDAKGFTGLADAQTRDKQSIDTHLNMSLLTVGLARAEHYAEVGLDSDKPFSMNTIKTRAANEHFALRILSSYGHSAEMIKNHPEFENIRNYAIAVP